MIKFSEWIKDKEKSGKLIAMRRWMWNQEHGTDEQKKAQSPLHRGDPDFDEINNEAKKLGPLDPYNAG